MIRLQTLGSIDLQTGERERSTLLAQPKRLALLIYLATARPVGFQSRDRLLALFWPESDVTKARNSLRQSLHQLRRSLGDDVIRTRGEREVGVDLDRLVCDAGKFDEAIRGGRNAESLELYRGDFLPGFHVPEADEALRWIDDERLRRKRDASEAARRLVEDALGNDELQAALRWAHRGVELDPTDESAVQRLLRVHAATGDVAAAKAAFGELTRRLETEFGARPSRETAQLVRAISERPATTTEEFVALLPRLGVSEKSVGLDPADIASARRGVAELPNRESAPAEPGERAVDRAVDRGLGRTGARAVRAGGRRASIVAVAVALVAVLGWLVARGAGERTPSAVAATSAAPELASIAVLPFVNLSGDARNDYLSDGMTEELLNLLARVPGLRVAARTSAFTFKGSQASIDSIGRALRVRHVLEGSIRRNGERWRVTAQLIDASTGYHLWSDNFEASLANVVSLQDQIGREIVERLRGDLAPALGTGRVQPADPAATLATLKGWQAFRLNSREAYAAAITLFEDAVRRDPNYGYAHAGLATVRHWQATLRWVPAESSYALARASANRALALDSTLVDGWLILGRSAEVLDQDFAAAESYYARAIEMAPSDSRPYSRRATMLSRLGRTAEALSSAEQAVSLDPASPAVYSDLSNLYAELNRFADAESALRRALALDPGHPLLLGNLSLHLAHQRKYRAADSVIVLVRAQVPEDPTLMGQHAFIVANLGQVQHARALVDSAAVRGLSKVNLAATLLVVGDTGATYALLERAVREGDDGLPVLMDSSMFAGLRHQPRFERLVATVRAGRATR